MTCGGSVVQLWGSPPLSAASATGVGGRSSPWHIRLGYFSSQPAGFFGAARFHALPKHLCEPALVYVSVL